MQLKKRMSRQHASGAIKQDATQVVCRCATSLSLTDRLLHVAALDADTRLSTSGPIQAGLANAAVLDSDSFSRLAACTARLPGLGLGTSPLECGVFFLLSPKHPSADLTPPPGHMTRRLLRLLATSADVSATWPRDRSHNKVTIRRCRSDTIVGLAASPPRSDRCLGCFML